VSCFDGSGRAVSAYLDHHVPLLIGVAQAVERLVTTKRGLYLSFLGWTSDTRLRLSVWGLLLGLDIRWAELSPTPLDHSLVDELLDGSGERGGDGGAGTAPAEDPGCALVCLGLGNDARLADEQCDYLSKFDVGDLLNVALGPRVS
jgi:hypothetical protein